jgi:glycosidase
MSSLPSWLDKAVFYEIYPQSFYDSNGDGIGDIPGIIQRLDYVESLGVNAIWLNPCFESPFQDAGYDVSNYYLVAPRYGTNEDLKALFLEAAKRGIRVLLDLVPGHTSTQCAWFQQSSQHTRNSYSDWYIWTDNVWSWELPGLRSIMGYSDRDGAYITNFFHFQPALNFGFAQPDPRFSWQQSVNQPGPQAVRQEFKKIMAYWLDMGASGFRVDMAASLVKNDPGWVETGKLWQEYRAWLEQNYPEAVLVSEWGFPSRAIPSGFHMDFLLHFNTAGFTSLFRKSTSHGPGTDAYGFSYFDRSGHGNIRQFIDEYLPHYEQTKGLGYIALISGNHDIPPRLANHRDRSDLSGCFLFLLTMPGTPFIYYGDEIGMRSQDLPSKEGGYKRTGVRTPMQWDKTENLGFSSTPKNSLYLPVDESPNTPLVSVQDADPESILNTIRAIIALRNQHTALAASGDFRVLHAVGGDPVFVYERSSAEERLLIVINPSDQPRSISLPGSIASNNPETLFGPSEIFQKHSDAWQLNVPPVSAGLYKIPE